MASEVVCHAIYYFIFELFFVKKSLLVGAWGMLWAGGSVVQWISGSVRDVCMSHQSDWIYY